MRLNAFVGDVRVVLVLLDYLVATVPFQPESRFDATVPFQPESAASAGPAVLANSAVTTAMPANHFAAVRVLFM